MCKRERARCRKSSIFPLPPRSHSEPPGTAYGCVSEGRIHGRWPKSTRGVLRHELALCGLGEIPFLSTESRGSGPSGCVRRSSGLSTDLSLFKRPRRQKKRLSRKNSTRKKTPTSRRQRRKLET